MTRTAQLRSFKITLRILGGDSASAERQSHQQACFNPVEVPVIGVGSYISPKVDKGVASQIECRGLVARAPIARGEIVAIKGGHIVDSTTYAGLDEHLRNSDIQVADDFHIVALDADEYEDVMLFLNHSCEPNVGVAGNVVFVAMRDISAGEELTTDYALFDDYEGAMTCRCQRPSCRPIISGKDWRRPELQAKYAGYFSSFRTTVSDAPLARGSRTRIRPKREWLLVSAEAS